MMLGVFGTVFRPICWLVGHDYVSIPPRVEQTWVRSHNILTGKDELIGTRPVVFKREECGMCGHIRLAEVSHR